MYTQFGQLRPTPPFSFDWTLRFLSGFSPMKNEQTLTDQTLTKAVAIGSQVFVFRVKSVGSVEEPLLEYQVISEQPLTEEQVAAVVDRISFFLSLPDDLKPFYELARKDPYFEGVAESLYGYHQVKFFTPFESVCWAILSQRNLMNVAQKMKAEFAARYGSQLELDGKIYPAFPEPARIAALNPLELEALFPNMRRGEYIWGAAQAFSKADEQFLRNANYAEVYSWLRKIKGIGEWSASFIMLRGLGRMERLPEGEDKVHQAATRFYGSEIDMTQAAKLYGPYQGYWAHYLRVAP